MTTYLVHRVAHSHRIRYSLGDLITQIHLLLDRVHRLVNLIHISVCHCQQAAFAPLIGTDKLLCIPLNASAPFLIATIVSAFKLADSSVLTCREKDENSAGSGCDKCSSPESLVSIGYPSSYPIRSRAPSFASMQR